MEVLGQVIGWTSAGLGVICTLMGVYLAWKQRNASPPSAPPKSTVGEQGISDAINATADFAKALKDLDSAGQLLTIGVLFIAVAAVVAGFDTVASAITTAAGK